jgi:hypothetical protein
VYTQVEGFTSAMSELQALGFKVNLEQSTLVYRGTTGEGSMDNQPTCML